ncbi:hypothetical protein HDV00_006563 [Rhizophlyctis rosea]|nr:hypothetical protein HDV00_006563 [Rhizophlyctis rosea]
MNPILRRTPNLIRTTRAIHTTPAMFTNIRGGGTGFSQREAAEEERYAHEKELEDIRKLKESLAKREKDLQAKVAASASGSGSFGASGSQDKSPKPKDPVTGAPLHGGKTGSDAFGKREAANEERYIREKERENAGKKH